MVKLISVKVPARWCDNSPLHEIGQPEYKHADAMFTLGLGPCGKVVERMDCDVVDGGAPVVAIEQYCTDGTVKAFIYPFSQLTGRIELVYE